MATTHLDTETNIVKIVKSRRYFKAALKMLLSRENRKQLKEKSRYISIDPGSDCDGQVDDKNIRSILIRQ